MRNRDIIVIGGSAGALEPLAAITSALPPELPAAVFVVIHFNEAAPSRLPEILARTCVLPVAHATDGDAITCGRVVVARPGFHLVLESEHVRLTNGALEHSRRPAVDVSFRTAAEAHGAHVAAVVLSGALDDGAAGMQDVKRLGGLTVAQRPAEALYSSMPRNAIESVDIDYVLPAAEIAAMLTREASRTPRSTEGPNPLLEPDPEVASTLSCPDCGGVLMETSANGLMRFRCRTGHRYGPESLIAAQDGARDAALWAARRALEERIAMASRLAERARKGRHPNAASRFERRIELDRRRVDLIRAAIDERDVTEDSDE